CLQILIYQAFRYFATPSMALAISFIIGIFVGILGEWIDWGSYANQKTKQETKQAIDELVMRDAKIAAVVKEIKQKDTLTRYKKELSNKNFILVKASIVMILSWFLLILIWLLPIAAIIFWVSMFLHAITQATEEKALWIILILLIPIVGAMIYYIQRKFYHVKLGLEKEKRPFIQITTTPAPQQEQPPLQLPPIDTNKPSS
ncbi:MAG: PLDc N-terminal domain-containing protein, partial [bacterium]|nr:PLDc N-terminal domain-containing protein [bacterium]